MDRPGPDECAEFYQKYIDELGEGDVLTFLESQMQETVGLVENLSEENAGYRYADGKWSIKEILGHLIDAERVFVFRAMCFARNDAGPFPGMDENPYVAAANFDRLRLSELLTEYLHVRQATVQFFKNLDEPALLRRGMASECEFTVRAFAWIIAGHERHHLQVLKEKYLSQIKEG